jgi:GBP family porin
MARNASRPLKHRTHAVAALVLGGWLALPFMALASQPLTLYGIVDLSLYHQKLSRAQRAIGGAVNGSELGMTSGVLSGSRWGLKGSEQISTDLSIDFVLEGGVNAQNGTLAQGGLAFGRQSTLGVSSDRWGTLQFGRRGNFAYTYMVPIDPFAVSGSQAGMGTSFGSSNGVRPNNLIMYETSTIHGWQGGIGYSFNTGFSAIYANDPNATGQSGTNYFGNTENMRMLTAGLHYKQGPVMLMLSYDQVFGASQVIGASGQTVSNVNQASPKAWILGGSYDFKLAKISAVIGQTFDGVFFGQGAGAGGYSTPLNTFSDGNNILFAQSIRSFQYALGASIPAGPSSKVFLSWQGLKPSGSLKSDNQLATQNVYSAAYIYSLSKRTDLYVWGSYGHNYQTFSTAKSSVIGTGIRHLF